MNNSSLGDKQIYMGFPSLAFLQIARYVCLCPPDYIGQDCSELRVKNCSSNMCLHGATCNDVMSECQHCSVISDPLHSVLALKSHTMLLIFR